MDSQSGDMVMWCSLSLSLRVNRHSECSAVLAAFGIVVVTIIIMICPFWSTCLLLTRALALALAFVFRVRASVCSFLVCRCVGAGARKTVSARTFSTP